MSPLKIEFDTVRDLERKTFRVFSYGGGAFALGLLLTLVGLLPIGVPLMLLSGCAIIGAIVWVTMLGKEPTKSLFCPYCSCPNEVYTSRQGFSCDICRRPVTLDESGQAVMALDMDA